jgi:hypothetical protein
MGIERRSLSLLVGLVVLAAPAVRAWRALQVVLVVKDARGHDLPDARVSVDGRQLVDRVEGHSVTVDPGEHHLLFQAAGFNPIETTVVAREGQQHALRVVVFLIPSAGAVAADGESSRNEEPFAAVPRWRKQVAGALAGAAAGSLVVGTIWSFLAKAKYDHALETECGGSASSCSTQGIADGRTAHDRAVVATVAFVGAAAFLAGAATVYFAWPTTQDRIAVSPAVSGNGAGVTFNW